MISVVSQASRVGRTCSQKPSNLGSLARAFSGSAVSRTPRSIVSQPTRDDIPSQPQDLLLTVQTHTGIGNMTHALHILRAIEKEYGPIASYIFPREPGSGDYLPSFLFKFRDTQSLYKLSKPYTHLDIPAFPPQFEPNHSIGLKEIHRLAAPMSSSSLINKSEHPHDPVKTRFALRIEISEKRDYPQQRLPPQVNLAQKKEHIQRALATWQPAASLFSSPSVKLQQPLTGSSNTSETATGLYADNASPGVMEENHLEQEVSPPTSQTMNSLPLRMRPRLIRHPNPTSLPLAAHNTVDAEPPVTANGPNTEPATTSHIDSHARSIQHSNSKRERILQQTRQAAATKAKSIADREAAAEAAAVATQRAREAEARAPQSTPSSIWSRFMGR